MTARDILTPTIAAPHQAHTGRRMAADTPVLQILPELAANPEQPVEIVGDDGVVIGTVGAGALLGALDNMMSGPSADTSWVEMDVAASDYSASAVARAVEDADATLLALVAEPDKEGVPMMHVSLHVDHADPSAVVHSLSRYGYDVRYASGGRNADLETARERYAALALYLNV